MKKHFPNTLTCCNLISGCIATYFAFQANYETAFLFIIIGAVFDFFDGFAARLLHVSSAIGKELDSLADDITFGFAPSAIVYALLSQSLSACTTANADFCPTVATYLPFVAFLMAAFSGLRLAKFNIDERQTTTFIGLPTPANALFWASLSVAINGNADVMNTAWIAPVLIIGVLLSSWLLVCEVPMFALKFKTFGLKDNLVRYGFVAMSLILLLALGWVGFSAIIVLYVLTSIANNVIGTKIANEE